jgi:glyoxylase-like metal-dependent hydrolase (beta-lactamase superfamily II)
VAAHPLEAELLESATFVIPPGTNRLTDGAAYYGRRNDWVLKLVYEFLPTPVDILTETETTLSDFGFSARMIPTPGHTAGSMSVLTETGEAFIGDLAINYAPVWPGPSIPPFGESIDEILNGWRRLLEAGAKRFYPGHGPSFTADQMAQALDDLEHDQHRL